MGSDLSDNDTSSTSSMHSFPSSPSTGRNSYGWLGSSKDALNPTKIETVSSLLVQQNNAQMTRRGVSSNATNRKYYIEFPNRIEVTGNGMNKQGVPKCQDEEALKEWIWLNCKEKLMACMSIVEEDQPSSIDDAGAVCPNEEDSSTINEEDEAMIEAPLVAKEPEREEVGQAVESSERSQVQKRLDLMDEVVRVQRQFVQSESAQVVFGCMLDCLLRLTESEYGFINEVKYDAKGDIYLSSQAITDNSWSASTQKFFLDHVKRGLRFYNMKTLFGIVVTTKQPVISNDPKNDPRGSGIPDGHPVMDSFLGIPFFKKDGEISGMVGIANKPGGYSQEDIDFLEPFTVTCSYLVQAYWQKRENKHLINTLEEKVAGRTRELKRANKNLEEANRRVVKASKLQLQHFACMSHEIRTPLNCIVGLSSVLQESELSPMQQESLRMIVNSGDLLLTVVNDVLDYAKLETGNVDIEIQRSNLQETLNSIVHSIQTRAQAKNVTFHTFYDVSVPKFVNTDSRRLQQILFNLLGNAVKFSGEEGGDVELRVTVTKVPWMDEDEDDEMNDSMTSLHHDSSTSVTSSISDSGSDSRVGDVCRAEEYNLAASPDEAKTSSCPMHSSHTSSGQPSCPIHEGASNDKQSPMESQSAGISSCPIHRALLDSTLPRIDVHDVKKSIDNPSNTAHSSQPKSSQAVSEEHHRHANRQVLRFSVKDYGKGIAKSDFQRIFQPFLQASSETERVYGGTGLGLAIVSKLVNGLGGTISVDSQVGEWTEFTVDLPFEDCPTDVQSISRQLSSVRVVLVQQDGNDRQQVENIFRGCNISVESFSNIEDVGRISATGQMQPMDTSWKGPLVCLVDEDLYSKSAFDQLSSQYQTILLTSGPKYCITESQGHFRSLLQVLPSVLMQSIVDSVDTSIASRNDASLRMSRKSSVETANSIPFKELRVLIAEDNKINQKVLLRILKRLGFENVDIVDNGKKAVDSEASKPYDVVLMDMQMPIMDGIDACRLIVKREGGHPRARVIFVTAHVSTSFVAECERAGGSGFIPKPFNISQIEKCFQNLQSDFYYEMIGGNSESKSGMKLDPALSE